MTDRPRIVRFAEAQSMPWKNGGGETAEVAVHPPGAALGAFDWRISLATLTGDGPFSTFEGVDRGFAILDGESLALTVEAGPSTRLSVSSAPIRFAGEAPCRCALSGGPATAFNVMVRRGVFDFAVARLAPRGDLPRSSDALTAVVCAGGSIATTLGPLGPRDVLLIPGGCGVEIGTVTAAAQALVVSIRRAAGSEARETA